MLGVKSLKVEDLTKCGTFDNNSFGGNCSDQALIDKECSNQYKSNSIDKLGVK